MMLPSKAVMHVVILVTVFLGAVSAAPRSGMLGMCVVMLSAVLSERFSFFSASLSPLEHTEHTIPEEYIVVFKEDANHVHGKLTNNITVCYFPASQSVEDHMNSLNDMLTALYNSSYRIMHKYHIGSFRGYSARMDDQ